MTYRTCFSAGLLLCLLSACEVTVKDDNTDANAPAQLNQAADRQVLLVVSARAAPRDCGFRLADLQSRLSKLPVFRVEPLDEAGRVNALRLRASQRGLELPDDTARFLLSRSRRDMASLYRLLDRLDAEALVAHRRLTIPFVRSVMQRLEHATE